MFTSLARHWSALPTQFPMWTLVICFALLYLIAHTHCAPFGFRLDCVKVASASASAWGLGPKMLTMDNGILCSASLRFASFLSPSRSQLPHRHDKQQQTTRRRKAACPSPRFCVLFFALHYLETSKCACVPLSVCASASVCVCALFIPPRCLL